MERTVRRFPDKAAFVFREKRVTWKELGRIVDRLVLALIDLGIRHGGDKVAVIFPNRLEFVFSSLVLARIGAINIPISERLREREIRTILDRTGTVEVIMVPEFWGFSFSELISNIKKDLLNLRHAIVSVEKHNPHEILLDELIERDLGERYQDDYFNSVHLKGHPVEPDDLLEIVFMSGTTGEPKGVMYTHNTWFRRFFYSYSYWRAYNIIVVLLLYDLFAYETMSRPLVIGDVGSEAT
jgi:long-subunit acyl-CoA synthetase (AMP-forming)